MPPKSTQKTTSLTVPAQTSTRTLRPPSPARKEPGFVVPPKDSRTSITLSSAPHSDSNSRASTPENGLPAPLSIRPATPRPPAKTQKKDAPGRTASQTQATGKPSAKGKVRSFILIL